MTAIKTPKKLIEVALPLDAINKAAAREKSIRHGHPSTLHLWWARRPLAAARAVIFAQMVNDPGYQQGGGFRYGVNKEKAQAERERLFEIIEDLVKWENTNNEEVLERARAEIRRSWREVCELNKAHPQATELFDPTKLPAFHDPFAGGGALPLEAQRLGLESYASDLNPVAVIINKAMIEIPPRFAGRAPIGSEGVSPSKESKDVSSMNFEGGTPSLPGASFPGARGLAEDVRRYGAWMRAEAEKRIGHLYPQVEITAEIVEERPDLKALLGRKLTVIAWLWARTVKSPNPAFSHVDVPLASTFILSSKAGKESYVQPVVEGDRYRFTVKVGMPPEGARNGTKLARGANFRCVLSDSPIEPNYIKAEGVAGRIGAKLMAIVAEGARGRVYLAPTTEHEAIARQAQPVWKPETVLPDDPRNFWTISYGLTKYGDLFTPRQLVALTTFSDLVGEAIEKCYLGARASRPRNLHHISSEGETPSLPGERLSDVSSPGVSPSSPYHRTHLPHFEAGEFPQHITLRLEDSLPVATLQAWDQELHAITSDTERQRERRQRIEAALDRGLGACWLRNPEVADLVARTLAYFDGTRYRLYAWVIMPNHVHVLVTPLHGYSLSSIVHSWKSFSAKEANTLLGRSGTFWQGDYFDRFIRNAEHWERAISYIHENPVKAGLCATAVEWPWSSVSRSLGSESPGSEGVSPSEKASNIEESRAGCPRSQDDVPLAEGGTGARAYAEAVSLNRDEKHCDLPGSEGVSPSEKASNIEESRAGRPRSQDDIPLAEGGTGARAYAEAVSFDRDEKHCDLPGSEGVSPSEKASNIEESRAGRPRSQDDIPLAEGGTGARAYAEAVGVYLAFAVDKVADRNSSLCAWASLREHARNTFGRQALPMTWDFAESNPLSGSSGNFEGGIRSIHEALLSTVSATLGFASQAAAQSQTISQNKVVSSDPPYYDNIGYADLSDFFYVWIRSNAKQIFPGLFATVAVPKTEELVATPYRHNGKEQAEKFFLDGMTEALHNLTRQAHPAFPVTIYYAFKQSETTSESGTSSTGWETFLEAVLKAGFVLTGTWPMRTELERRILGSGTNALASSIVLVCRQRPADAPTVSRREFIRELNAALPDALDEMTRGGVNSPVAPVDLSQAIIGPGMAIFSQYAAVLEADGTPMSVRTALQLINRFLAEDDFDHDTQFCLHWFEQQGWAIGKYGDADVLARAKGTSVQGLVASGVAASGKGELRLLKWAEMPRDWQPERDARLPVWEALHQLIRALNQDGESSAGALLARMPARSEAIRALAYRLYTLCERKGWAGEARAYNELVTAWSAIEVAAGEAGMPGSQGRFEF